jgi:tetratricopeptide (TPR) repeat protein
MQLGKHEGPDLAEDVVEDPRVTYAGPYRNVRPEVKYVGDAACAGCHKEQSAGFHGHPMGRAMTPVSELADRQSYDASVRNPFDLPGRRYRVDRKGERVFHEEIRKDEQGRDLVTTQAEIAWVIGSGAQAQSFMILRGEYAFQSPISWYRREQHWDLSPGFERIEDRFERPIQPECLFCHCNSAVPVKDTLNRYQMPLFPLGASIGCERCHGPGELHVRERQDSPAAPAAVDHSIVNPRHLEPALREAVCQQCHLEADRRILRRGRGVFDFRPGLPLYLFWSDFLRPPDLEENGKFVGKVEQMHSSRCFIQSKGKMGCSTCHESHSHPPLAAKTSYYRQRCLDCHQEKGCSLPHEARRANNDNCIGCHMPRTDSTDITHTAIADHRILRQPDTKHRRPVPRVLRPGEVPLVHFHNDLVAPDEREVQRDLGAALVEMARMPTPLAEQLGELALRYLEPALERGPRDAVALRGKAFVLAQQGRHREAVQLLDPVLARSPKYEVILEDAAEYADKAGQREKALDYARRLIAVNPWITRYRLRYAALLNLNKEYDRAVGECQEALTINPASVPLRSLLVSCWIRSGDKTRAKEEFDVIMKLNPPNKAELRQWFEQQMRGGQPR